MELTQLKQFMAVASCGNIVEASKELFISQPALTRSIQKLEMELGISLFDRSDHLLKLNRNGKLVLNYVELITGEEERMLNEVAEKIAEKTLKIGSPYPIVMLYLIPEFTRLHPEINVMQELGSKNYMKSYLLKRYYDVIITKQDFSDDYIKSELFLEDKLYVSVPEGNKLYNKERIKISDLTNQAFVVCNNDNLDAILFKERARKLNVNFKMQTGLDACYNLIKYSNEYLMFSSTIARDYLNMPNRKFIPLDEKGIGESSYYISYLKENRSTVNTFLKWIKTKYKERIPKPEQSSN